LKSERSGKGHRLRHCTGIVVLVFAALVSGCHGRQRTVLTLSAAASLQGAIVEAQNAYKHNHAEVDFRNNFGSSGTLAREIEDGAPVDVFLSAAAKPMDDLESKGLIAAGTRRNLLRNTLVLIAPRDSQAARLSGLDG
jgi:molybdate transport system substrate-binding protein